MSDPKRHSIGIKTRILLLCPVQHGAQVAPTRKKVDIHEVARLGAPEQGQQLVGGQFLQGEDAADLGLLRLAQAIVPTDVHDDLFPVRITYQQARKDRG